MELFPGLTQSMSFFFCKAMDNVVSYHHEFLMPEHLLLSVCLLYTSDAADE